MPRKVAVGIDLGTTHSRVAAYKNGSVEIIANERGSRFTPSCVAFTKNRRLIGAAAANQAGVNPSNSIFEVKRLIGRRFTDPIVQRDVKKWPFVVINSNEAPKYKVQYKSEEKIITPEQISAMVLGKMKAIAETFLEEVVSDAVITVPAYFTNSQRQATKDAGEIAGLNVLKIINEPTAAAIAYGLDKEVASERNILIYDLGGGTFDVAVLSIAGGVFDVKAVGGNTHLGGVDFDDRLVNHFLKKISKIHKVDLSSNQRALIRLRCACESAKRQLSSTLETKIEITGHFDRKDFISSISRARFEDLCSDLFQQTMMHVSTTLDDSGLSKDDIHEVVLVGGSTRIQKIQQLLRDFFNGKELNKTLNPDEAVAYGAAIEAAVLSGDNTVEEVKLADVTPRTLAVKRPDGTGTLLIKRSTKIPAKATVSRTADFDYQTCILFSIYEGEDIRCKTNNLLGKFELDKSAYARVGISDFHLEYEIDENIVLHAFAIDLKTSCVNAIPIINKSNLQPNEIDQMIAEVVEFNRNDLELSRQDRARENLEKYCIRGLDVVGKAGGGSSDPLREDVRSECGRLLEWIDLNGDADELEYVELLEDAKEACEEKLVLIMMSSISNTVRILGNILS